MALDEDIIHNARVLNQIRESFARLNMTYQYREEDGGHHYTSEKVDVRYGADNKTPSLNRTVIVDGNRHFRAKLSPLPLQTFVDLSSPIWRAVAQRIAGQHGLHLSSREADDYFFTYMLATSPDNVEQIDKGISAVLSAQDRLDRAVEDEIERLSEY